MSSAGVPWQAWDSHRSQISLSDTSGSGPYLNGASTSLSESQRTYPSSVMWLLNAASLLRLGQYLIWIQDVFSSLLLATQFHIHYILLSYFVVHFTFLYPHKLPIPNQMYHLTHIFLHVRYHLGFLLCVVFDIVGQHALELRYL